MRKVKITITGRRVHNVGYRLFLLDEAEGRFIPHFDARNVKIKGRQAVVALAGGDEEKVMDFVEYVKSAPYESASVSRIEVEDYKGDIRTIDSFRNSFSTRQLFKIANIGVGMLERQDKMLEKQDTTIEILRSVKEDTSKIREDTSKIHEVADNTSRTNILIEERFDNLQSEIERIKRALEREGITV